MRTKKYILIALLLLWGVVFFNMNKAYTGFLSISKTKYSYESYGDSHSSKYWFDMLSTYGFYVSAAFVECLVVTGVCAMEFKRLFRQSESFVQMFITIFSYFLLTVFIVLVGFGSYFYKKLKAL